MSDRKRPETVRSAAAASARGRAKTQALLQVWLSPSFPIGAYAYSHGLEKAVELGWVKGREGLEAWLADLVAHGGLNNDLVLLAAATRAARTGDEAGIRDLAELSAALQPSAERHLEATQQGRSFLQQLDAAWPREREGTGAGASASYAALFGDTTPALAVVLGVAAADRRIDAEQALLAYAVAFVSNLVSAAIRLGVTGQTDGQRAIAGLMPALEAAAQRAAGATLDDLGGASFRSDIASMQHETQYTRIFRS